METLPKPIPLNGIYRIIELNIAGDTRGNDWYYDMIGIGQQGNLPEMLADQSQSGVA